MKTGKVTGYRWARLHFHRREPQRELDELCGGMDITSRRCGGMGITGELCGGMCVAKKLCGGTDITRILCGGMSIAGRLSAIGDG